MNHKINYDKKNLPFGHSSAVDDEDVLAFLQDLSLPLENILLDKNITSEFLERYLSWILNYKNNKLIGIEDYKFKVYSLGTTEAFDKFYIRHSKKRFRCFKAEYMYHQLSWRTSYDWCYIEDGDIDENDAVVISYPFADTGSKHQNTDNVLERCERINVPVLIDCAYYNISKGMNIDLRYNCIEDITFSLSKVFPVAHARIGMRLSRKDYDDALFVYTKANYNNRLGCALGKVIIDKFDNDYVVKKYTNSQKELCEYLGIKQSSTVLFGIADNDFIEYNRGGSTNRLGLHKFLNKDLNLIKGEINGSAIS